VRVPVRGRGCRIGVYGRCLGGFWAAARRGIELDDMPTICIRCLNRDYGFSGMGCDLRAYGSLGGVGAGGWGVGMEERQRGPLALLVYRDGVSC